MHRLLFVFAVLTVSLPAFAQTAPPATDIYVVDLQEGAVVLAADGPVKLTDRDGYDNQPFFSPDGRHVLFTSHRDGQTDIYQVRLSDGEIQQVTQTPESEYSPTVTPDGAGISVIRVEADETQRLWRFDRDGQNPTLLFKNIKPVGYHAWVDADRVAMFILGEPATLQIGILSGEGISIAAEDIGRSLHRIPGTQAISFVHKKSDSVWHIRRLDSVSGKIENVAPTLSGREDYAWTPAGNLLMADGAILHRWHSDKGAWVALYNFASHGVATITRLAVSPDGDKLAFVANR